MLNNFAHNIEEERKSLDFTQVLFSKMLGVSVSTYKNIISRKTNNLDVFLALRLSELTHKPIPDLLGCSSKEYEVLGKYRQRAYIRRYVQRSKTKLVPINGFGDVIEVDPNSFEDMEQWVRFGVVIAVLRR